MIEELVIRDLGVIKEATLPLGPGFTAVTGETGAGKTMVVTALGLLLGARADPGLVRHGAQQTWVEGRWQVDADGTVAGRVRDAGGDLDGPDLILSRSVSAEGRSRAIVGGRSAPASVLGDLGGDLVVVHGQSDQVRLRSAGAQRAALDRFAGPELGPVLTDFETHYHRWQDDRAELARLVTEQDERTSEAADLRAAIDEIEAIAPQAAEDDDLAARAERLGNLEELRLAAAQSRELLSAEENPDGLPDAVTLLDAARRQLERAGDHDPALSELAQSLANAGFLVADVAAQLSSYLAGLDADGARELEIVQERRAVLTGLARKYAGGLDEAIAFLDTGSARLLELDGDTDRIEQLRADTEAELLVVEALADRLTGIRTTAAAALGTAVTAELSALAMPDAALVVEVDSGGELTAHGRDQVGILLRPHAGAEPRTLARGASGGELSRVMLAIEVVINATDPVPTFVFDEVDAGVGGAAAIEIGRRLARLAETAQVIVVTHLAQVAAFAGNHLSVVKDSDGSVTESSVRQLTGDDRAAEMARLLSGLPDSVSGLEHARELMNLASAGGSTKIR
ncbi:MULTISPECIES: DNA repair protein RecN [unclassified Cryobacterium]|uniref:DNA repair protein RecN n=1 Tax=unclassified Cryobacterium TaxID=2649013 RepID=UPI00106D18B2|nr:MULTISPECIES: DNA repair protein RecN [unclassified Cryobacterium]TFB97648.1 DNA repair protein RecN [Cryobacterium sp. MDB2-A-1]TFC03709.1 DNA repair protein RecN [Cryobacterium sp. MDB2-33-2]TFC07769.1 DNA repair protein RecN [Cryobacterium sp. MDB2-A-2]TFC21010.1 DNA repair protein RecN [Cryobacterium sp. MDB2-10]TFC32401.1 DNA repair protein RecN [Cryobacterium sp. MDB1-18-2]